MTIDDAINQLQTMKFLHGGGTLLVDDYDNEIEKIDVEEYVRYFKDSDIILTAGDEHWIKHIESKNTIVTKGKCIKLY